MNLCLLQLADEISSSIASELRLVRVPHEDAVAQFLMASLLSCHNLHQSVVLLVRNEMSRAASICLRSLLEQSWVFHAVAKQETRQQAFIALAKADGLAKKRNLQNLRNLPEDYRDHRITNELLAESEELCETEKTAIATWAKWARGKHLYAIEYAFLCGRVHASRSVIEEHLVKDEDGRPVALTGKPGIEYLDMHIASSNELMVGLLTAYSEAYPNNWSSGFMNAISHLSDRVGKSWDSVPDMLSTQGAIAPAGHCAE